jgi:hypothetical protein
MDPDLEAFWGDVHTSLVTYARDQLRGQMPPDLKVRVEEHVSIQAENGGYTDLDYRLEPDPPLHGPDAAWADALLCEKNRR